MKPKVIYIGLVLIAVGILLAGCAGPKADKGSTEKNDVDMKTSSLTEQENKDYTTIKDREKNMPYAGLVGDDYVRIITLDELADRIAAADKFIAAYPKSTYQDEIAVWRSEYLHDYLFGNFKYTSSFDWMNGSDIFLEEYLKSYEASKLKYKGTAFAAILDEYTILIKNEGNKMTDKVRDFVKNNSEYKEVIFKLPS